MKDKYKTQKPLPGDQRGGDRMADLERRKIELKRTEEAFREKEQYYQSLLSNLHEDILVIDRDRRITDAYSSYLISMGYRREDVIGRHCYEICHGYREPCEANGEDCLLDEVLLTGKERRFQHEHIHADGSKRWIDVLLSPLNGKRGSATHVIQVARDVTDFIRVKNALEESQERYALTTKAGQVGVWDWNLESNEIYLDPNLKAMLGYADHEIRNHLDDWSKFVHPDDTAEVMAKANAHLEGRVPLYEVVHRMLHKDGSIRWFLARGRAIRDADGKPYRVLGTDTDITERKRAEDEREILRKRLEESFTKILSGFINICAKCKKIRNDRGDWIRIEEYISSRTGADFSHGLCPQCIKELYPEYEKT